MRIFAIGDLHLSFGIPNKSMDKFGPRWENHAARVKESWEAEVNEDDLILLPGDISWALKLEEAFKDLEWLDALPGKKVMIRGNHDYWWPSLKKLNALPYKSLHYIHNTAYTMGDISIGGSRLWDSTSYDYSFCFPNATFNAEPREAEETIFQRELIRLEESLKKMNPSSPIKIAMTHYPPLGPDLKSSEASALFHKYGIQIVVFGHLHGARNDIPLFGKAEGISYILTSCDHLNCRPLKILD